MGQGTLPIACPHVGRIVRWVQYEAAVFVRIEVDQDGWDSEITRVVTANEVEDLHLARDDRGHFMVYDEKFDEADESEVLDGIRGAVSIAEDRHRWPERQFRRGMRDPILGPTRYWYAEDHEIEDDEITEVVADERIL